MDWSDTRDLFPVTEQYAYFQHAAVTALSLPAREAIAEISREMSEDGCLNESRWIKRIETIRTRAGRLINVPPARIGFVKNTSHGLSIIANSFPFEPGDEIVVPEKEFPANVYPWTNVAKHKDLNFQSIPRARDGGIYLDQIRNTISDNTRLLSISSVQFHNGFRANLETIGAFCKSHDIAFVVDGIQSIGWDFLDCHSLPVDALVADGHKWMCGPEGTGIIYLSESFQQKLRFNNIGWKSVKEPFQFSQWDFDLKESADVIEEGSANTFGIMALGASLKLILKIGIKAIRQRNLSLRDYASEELNSRGFDIPSLKWDPVHYSPILSINHDNLEMTSLKNACIEENIQASVRDGQFRLSFHFYNNRQEIDKLLDVVDELL